MQVNQSIRTPLGLNVFGSALLRVSPDVAVLNFSVSHLSKHPREAFSKTREGVQRVRDYLSKVEIEEVSTSRISLEEARNYVNGEHKFLGYRARVQFNVLLYVLDHIEDILIGLVEAGVNKISSVNYETTELKALRADARRMAVRAAREKALIYCDEAGVSLGRVIHLEDVNPDQLAGREGHSVREMALDEDAPLKAFDPGSIVVKGAVMITFEIE